MDDVWTVEPYRGDRRVIGALLGRAFRDDPLTVAVGGAEPRRRELWSIHEMTWLADAALRRGYVDVVRHRGEVIAAALTFGPAARAVQGLGCLFGPVRADEPGAAIRYARWLAFQRARRPRAPHVYFPILGGAAAYHGVGATSALMRAVLRRVDEAGLPIYAEIDSPVGRRFVEKHGFVVEDESTLPGLPAVRVCWARRPASGAG